MGRLTRLTVTIEMWRVLLVALLAGNLLWAGNARLAIHRLQRELGSVQEFADSVRVDLKTKQCVYLPLVPRDTIRRRG